MASPEVTQAIGTPICEGWLVTGQPSNARKTDEPLWNIPISGPKGDATIHLHALQTDGTWQFTDLVVEMTTSGKRIELLPADGAPDPPPRKQLCTFQPRPVGSTRHATHFRP